MRGRGFREGNSTRLYLVGRTYFSVPYILGTMEVRINIFDAKLEGRGALLVIHEQHHFDITMHEIAGCFGYYQSQPN